jgi:DNA-binding CsgD family transcriptional regulator
MRLVLDQKYITPNKGGWRVSWTIRAVERRVSPARRRELHDRAADREDVLNRRRGGDRRVSAQFAGGGTVRLTKREQEIKDLIAAGLGNKEIARQLNIATNTVKSHVHNMLGKLAAIFPPDRRQGNRRRGGTSRRSYWFSRG